MQKIGLLNQPADYKRLRVKHVPGKIVTPFITGMMKKNNLNGKVCYTGQV